LITKITCEGEPPHAAAAGDHYVEFVTMDDQNSLAGGSYVNCVLLNLNISVRSAEAGHQLVVISRDVYYARALASFAQNFLDYVVVLLWPVSCAPQ
jgi:hypothetical protein